MLAENVDRYLEYMEEAKRLGGDIIVFPEYGVSGSAVSEAEDREAAREVAGGSEWVGNFSEGGEAANGGWGNSDAKGDVNDEFLGTMVGE